MAISTDAVIREHDERLIVWPRQRVDRTPEADRSHGDRHLQASRHRVGAFRRARRPWPHLHWTKYVSKLDGVGLIALVLLALLIGLSLVPDEETAPAATSATSTISPASPTTSRRARNRRRHRRPRRGANHRIDGGLAGVDDPVDRPPRDHGDHDHRRLTTSTTATTTTTTDPRRPRRPCPRRRSHQRRCHRPSPSPIERASPCS